ncbi:NTP transferase domain-containing protein [Altererythrobacter xixiisoli]|uniref:N-acylneuraminate cytidylyltransferase n=1 Tax=Croceibacterium xixiisoli TaxID=1476466 RepID=A0A6I4TWV3_9SPHN|nr:acylneuraminate cytidylyltransferase [Croceibacterium xixiisoli]MXO99108.1 NTP transferase domain-containing protein [Croceibacterium xixiisoli]
MGEQVLAVIPARGGSKGIPGKNIKLLGGIPLIAHNIRAALAARTVSRVVVSTDDDAIAKIARDFGADVVMRPAALATDTAKSEDALLHVLTALEESEDYRPDVVLLVQCTSPLTSAEDIDGVVTALFDGGADSSVAVAPFHYFLWGRDAAGEGVAINHDKRVRLMRQQREPEFIETGAVYAMRVPGFRQTKHRFFGRTVLHETPIENRLEIDDPIDFQLAEERLAMRRRQGQIDALQAMPQAIVFDFDGVFTDDCVVVDENGKESVICSRRDGMGIESLRKAGVPMVVISKEKNPVVAARCRKLQLDHFHGVEAKLELMTRWLADRGFDPAATVYIGNDINDVACMAHVGTAVAPRDAHPSALAAADIVLDADGGQGAIRLFADLLEARFPV